MPFGLSGTLNAIQNASFTQWVRDTESTPELLYHGMLVSLKLSHGVA